MNLKWNTKEAIELSKRIIIKVVIAYKKNVIAVYTFCEMKKLYY